MIHKVILLVLQTYLSGKAKFAQFPDTETVITVKEVSAGDTVFINVNSIMRHACTLKSAVQFYFI